MPVTIRVLSWNVESLGDTKAVQPGSNPAAASELINFINLVVRATGADVVGIMELKAQQGQTVCNWLLSRLNNGVAAGVVWKGVVSSRQDGGAMEEYVVLWKEQAGRLTLDPNGRPAPASLIGVVDDNAFSWLFDAKGWNALLVRSGFYAALAANGYIAAGRFKLRSAFVSTACQRVLPAAWRTLSQMPTPAVKWTNPPTPNGLTPADNQRIASTLLDIDILRFVTYGDRSPFLVNFLVGATSRPLAVMLLHAPGPKDMLRTDPINVIGLSRPGNAAASGGNLLIMGDFNIGAKEGNLTGRVYARYMNAQNQFVFQQVSPVQTQQVFAPITGGPLNATDLLQNARTSLTNAYLADNASPNAALANTYDKFFFRGAAAMQAASPSVVDLVDRMNGASANHAPAISASGLRFFRQLRGASFLAKHDNKLQFQVAKSTAEVQLFTKRVNDVTAQIALLPAGSEKSLLVTRLNTAQGKLTKAQQMRASFTLQRTALKAMLGLVNNPGATSPTGVGSALTTYRFAVSDHLPITVDLTA